MNITAQTRRPGRPKSEEKAEAIREAAGQLFLAEGMERTSMDKIAQAAGVSKQTVYSHFRSKDDLFRACVSSKVEHYGLEASRLDTDTPIDETLRRVGRQFLTLISDPEVVAMFRLMAAEATVFPRVVQSFHEIGPTATLEYVASIFDRHLDGDNRALARQAASDFLSLVKGELFMEMLLGRRTEIPEPEMNAHVDHCVAAIRKLYDI